MKPEEAELPGCRAEVLEHLLRAQGRMLSCGAQTLPELVCRELATVPGVGAARWEAGGVPRRRRERSFSLGGNAGGRAVLLRIDDEGAFAPYASHVETLCATLRLLADGQAPRGGREQRDPEPCEARERQRALFSAVPDPLVVVEAQTGRLVECNDAAVTYFGRSRGELLEMTFGGLLPPGPLREGMCAKGCQRRVAAGRNVPHVRLCAASGEIRRASIRISGFTIAGSAYSLCVFRDETGPRSIIRQLDRSREELDYFRLLFESMAENMLDMLWAKDTNSRFLFANRAIRENLLCSDEEDVLGKSDLEFAERQRALGNVHTFGELCVDSDKIVLETGVAGRFEEDGLVRGRYLALDVQKSPLYDRNGVLIGTVGTGRDVTDRKCAEEELRTKSALLEAQNNASLDAILVVNGLGERVLHNRRLVELFKPPPETLLVPQDLPLREHMAALAADPEAFRASVERYYSDRQSIGRDEFALRDGRMLERYTAPVVGQDGICYGRIWAFRDITQRKQAEAAVRQSEQRLRTLTRVAPVGIFQAGPDGRCVYVNEYWAVISGFPCEAALGLGWLATLHPPHRKPALAAFRNCMKTGREFSEEFRFRSHGGEPLWFLLRAAPDYAPDGSFAGFIGAVINITQRKNMELALRNSREQLREVIDLVPHFIFAKDIDGRFLLANKAMADAYGVTVQDLIGKRDLDCAMDSGEAGAFRQDDLAAMRTGETQIVPDETMTDAHGVVHHLSTIKMPFRFSGTDSPAVLGVAVDITERRAAEDALRSESLRRSILMERSSDGIVIIDKDHRVVEANQRFADMLGYGRDEVLGLRTWDFEVGMDEQGLRRVFSALDRVNQVFETRHRRKDGSSFDVEVSAGGAIANGRALVLAICRDITSRREHQTMLFEAKEAAEAANKAKTLFLANMSHEIRTPLNGLLGMLQLIQASGVDGEVADFTAMALKAGRRLTNLLNDILDLSRIEAGRMPLHSGTFSLNELTTALRETFLLPHSDKGIALTIGIDPDVPLEVVGDEIRVRQILFNLVGNALKFTEQGEVRVNISRLAPAPDGRERFLFTVADTGIGIPRDKIDSVCLPFVQVADDLSRAHQGAGLGLSIVRSLALAMAGTLAFDSEPGRGTTVHLVLPFARGNVAAEDCPAYCACGRGGIGPLRLLLVEDEETSRLSTALALKRMGHGVDTVEDGAQALSALAERRYDCVLMDVQMRNMDGLEATRRIRLGADGVLDREVPVIALTACTMSGDKEKMLRSGMDGHVGKPVDHAQLREILAGLKRR
jgi:PAS domain S-box-containing protein